MRVLYHEPSVLPVAPVNDKGSLFFLDLGANTEKGQKGPTGKAKPSTLSPKP